MSLHANKMSFCDTSDTVVVINQVEGRTAFVKPSIQFSQIPEAVWSEWETQTLTFDEWNLNFQPPAVENTADDIKKETIFRANAESVKTPAKRKRDNVLARWLLLGDTGVPLNSRQAISRPENRRRRRSWKNRTEQPSRHPTYARNTYTLH